MLCVTFCKFVSVCFMEIGHVQVCVKFACKDTLSSVIFLVLQTLQTLGVSIRCPKRAAVAIRKLKKYLAHGQASRYIHLGIVHESTVFVYGSNRRKNLLRTSLFFPLGEKISSTQQKNNTNFTGSCCLYSIKICLPL